MKLSELFIFKKRINKYSLIKSLFIVGVVCSVFLILGLFLFRTNSLKPEHINNRSNICICMWYDEGVREYSDMTKKINKKYCNLHKYDFIYDNKRRLPDRKAHWECIPLIQKILNEYNYEYIVWIDSDAFFRLDGNFNLLEEIINKYENNEIIFSKDINNNEKHDSIINSGIIIIKNSEYTKKILNYWLTKECFDKRIDGFNDQGCIRYTHKNDIYNLKDKSVILPFGELQTFNPKENKTSLIIHLAGWKRDDRIKTIGEFKNTYDI